ncbi:MAG: nuclear transport factor 2 family protein [Arenicellaceae bacterium]|nr:nuclear transport factor 2 family protein [Arenicellaceae bacterium]
MKLKNFVSAAAIAISLSTSTFVSAQSEVQDLADKWSAAYNAFDGEALGSLYTENAHLYEHGSPMRIGRDVIRAYWENDFGIESPLTILTVTQSVTGVDMMFVRGDYQVIDRGTENTLVEGKYAQIWHKVQGEWKVDQDLWNQPFE